MKLLAKMIGVEVPSVDDAILHIEEQAQAQAQEFSQEDKGLAEVKIVLHRNNDCQIIIELAENASTREEASAIARMLYGLNEGEMKSTMANIIIRESNNDINNTDFGKAIMDAWEAQYQEHDESFIAPSKVFEVE